MKTAALNARIPAGLKKALDVFCEEQGLKVQAFVEGLIQERLEDELDHRLMEERKAEEDIPLDRVVARLKKSRR